MEPRGLDWPDYQSRRLEPNAMTLESKYTRHYRGKINDRVYPTEWVVRAFLATYPQLDLDKGSFVNSKILDLGFGDGRNIEFLAHQGFDVFGLEISQSICDLTADRLNRQGVHATLRVGKNRSIPFETNFFDFILAAHSCYYLDDGDVFDTNLREIFRILKPGGTFIGSVPMKSNHYLEGAEHLGEGVYRITNDYYRVREGTLVIGLESQSQLEDYLRPYFQNLRIATWQNNFWGILEHVYLFVCTKPRN
jgi:SAM-dependent methyltransferase